MNDKKILLTTSWDDGHILDMKLAELLDKYQLPATFYIAPENRQIPSAERVTTSQVRELGGRFEIGAHTMTHPTLSSLDDAAARTEISTSKKTIEQWLGRDIQSFCYPSGNFGMHHKQMVADAGFLFARTVERFAFSPGDDPLASPTTVHAYRHWSDLVRIFKHVKKPNFLEDYLQWDDLAIAIFDYELETGGFFHLWGHSWEIEKNGDWGRLERVFRHIADNADVAYITNNQVP